MMISKYTELGSITIPNFIGHQSMIPFDLATLAGLPTQFVTLVKQMTQHLSLSGKAYFTIHGKQLTAGQTHRRPGAHTDGNYEPCGWSNGGWKVGENGPSIGTKEHHDSYIVETGGIILASNFQACLGWEGTYDGLPGVGGDCSKIELDEGKLLKANTVYYGNNHFIHESLPMSGDCTRVLARITLPQDHQYQF